MAPKEDETPKPGFPTYDEIARILPANYKPLQSPIRRMEALYELKRRIESNLHDRLGLKMVQVVQQSGRGSSSVYRTRAQHSLAVNAGVHQPTFRRPRQSAMLHLCA
jgi:hypothetical protein